MADAGTPGGRERIVLVSEYVTGGGLAPGSWTAELAAEGHAMRRALIRDLAAVPGVLVRVLLDQQYPEEEGPWETVWVETGGTDRDVIEREASRADHVIVLAPETYGLLAIRSAWVEAVGAGKLLGASSEAIQVAGHKGRLAERLTELGVTVPPYLIVGASEGLPGFEAFPYPAVIKPMDGAAAHGVFFLDDPERWPAGACDELPAILQRYVPGTPMSASFLVDNNGQAELVAVGRQQVVIEGGRFRYRGGVVPAGHHEMAREAARAVAAVPGLKGWVGVDFVWNEASGQAVVIEINPRVTMSFTGLCRRLPPGTLSRAWLAACGAEAELRVDRKPLWEQVDESGRPVCFDLRGTVRHQDEDL